MQAEIPNIAGEGIPKIFDVSAVNFVETALTVFRYQYQNIPVYRQFTDALSVSPEQVRKIEQIPFLPIRFFKTHNIAQSNIMPEVVFESSGTTQSLNSKHYVQSLNIYRQSFLSAFKAFYGNIRDWCIIGLLPSYLERNNSSLVVMVDELVTQSQHADSGFYLYEHEKLYQLLQDLEKRGQKTLLIGVTFALLDFAEKYNLDLKNTVVMETGGMKGRREEWTREQVHAFLSERLSVSEIHSEYGMTELLSQAYSGGNGMFNCPSWMKILLRDEDDPMVVHDAPPKTEKSKTGIINVIDLANIYSCSFIATDDVGRLYPDGGFEVLGRVDNSDIRGCSLMVL